MRGDDARAAELFEHITNQQLPKIIRSIDNSLNEHQVAELVARINYKLHHGGKMGQYKGPETFLLWLRQLARNERADFFREKQREAKVVAGSIDIEVEGQQAIDYGSIAASGHQRPDRAALSVEVMRAILACIDRLAPEDREIIERRSFREEEFKKIAAEMGTKTDNAYVRLNRARGNLMKCLEKAGVRIPRSRKAVKDKPGKDVSP